MRSRVWRAGARSERRRAPRWPRHRARLRRGRSRRARCNDVDGRTRQRSRAQAGRSGQTRCRTRRRTCWRSRDWSADADRAGRASRERAATPRPTLWVRLLPGSVWEKSYK